MLQAVKKDGLLYEISPDISVPHAFTARPGGVSCGCLSSLNIGTHRDDKPENVETNYRILGDVLGFSPENLVLSHQKHTDTVLGVDDACRGAGLYAPELPVCDGLVTNTPGLALTVFTADCTPILLYDPLTGAVGAVHAGWRGTASGIAARAVEKMSALYGSRPETLIAAIGPHIGDCCFETDADVPEAMENALGAAALGSIRQQGDKYYVNLTALNLLVLQQAGVTQVAASDLCTVCHPALFWSHRKCGNARGSQGAIIVCKEKQS